MILLTLNRGAGYALYWQLVWDHTEGTAPQEEAVPGEYQMILTLTQAQFEQCRDWLDQHSDRFENAKVVRRMFGN